MGWFSCKSEARKEDWRPRDDWRCVERPDGTFTLERTFEDVSRIGSDFWGPTEWRFEGDFKTLDEAWAGMHKVRLEEGRVIHLPPEDPTKLVDE